MSLPDCTCATRHVGIHDPACPAIDAPCKHCGKSLGPVDPVANVEPWAHRACAEAAGHASKRVEGCSPSGGHFHGCACGSAQ